MLTTTAIAAPHYKVMIVDDELPALTNMQLVLKSHPEWQLIASCHSTAQAKSILQTESIDLLLLDIEMPTQSGLDFAWELVNRENPSLIVFITAYNKHAVKAFELFALDYILKPFDDERFAAMLLRAQQSLNMKQAFTQNAAMHDYFRERHAEMTGEGTPTLSHVVIRSAGRIERFDVREIIWLAAAANYVEIHLLDRVLLHRATISSMEARLPKSQFLRLHRTAIVRADAIRSLETAEAGVYLVILSNGDRVRVSDSYVKIVKQLFSN